MTRPLDTHTKEQELCCSRSHDALANLIVEAGALSRHWRDKNFIETGAREADRSFLPGPDELGAGRFLCAKALRDLMRAFPALSDASRADAAIALGALVKALRTESATRQNRPAPISTAPTDPRRYWID